MRRIGWLAVVLSFSAVAGTPVALTPAQQQAILNEGTAFGQGALSVGAGTINSTGGAAGVPSYNTTPSGQAPGGAGLFGPATAKQSGCDGYVAPAGAGQMADQMDCDAVNFLAKNPNPKSAYPIDPNTDPTIQAGRAVLLSARDGSAFLPGGVAAGFGIATTQTECATTTTTTSPETTTISSCYIAATLSTQTCDKTLVCTVNQPPSIPATKLITGYAAWVEFWGFRGQVNLDCFAGGTLIGSCMADDTGSSCLPGYGIAGVPPTGSYKTNAGGHSINSWCYDSVSSVYTCPTNYTLSGTVCLPPAIGVSSTAYSCNAGAVLSGTNCIVYPAPTSATSVMVYSCPFGYTLSGTNCTIQTPYAATPTGTIYSCPSGYTLSGTTCSTPGSSTAATGTTYFSCPAGATLSGTSCIPSPVTIAATGTTNYSCPVGSTLSGTSCVYPLQTVAATASLVISTSGYWNRFLGYRGAWSLTCNTNGRGVSDSRGSGGVTAGCTFTDASGCYNSANNGYGLAGYCPHIYSTVYACSAGWTQVGTSCTYQQATSPATPSISYSCPAGYSLSGTSCTTQPASYAATKNTTYSCPSGYTYNGAYCIIPSVSIPATGTTIYSCPAGSTLSGSSCIPAPTVIPATGTENKTCPIGTTLVGSSCVYPATSRSPATATVTTTGPTITNTWQDGCAALQAKTL